MPAAPAPPPSELPVVIEQGVPRKLGYKPPDENSKMMRATATNIQMLREQNSLPPLIPQADWAEVDLVTGYPTSLILDQGSLGACTAFSDIGAGARMRYIRSGELIIPSSYYVYDQINHGQDNGSVITDSLIVMMTTGAPPLESYPNCIFQKGVNPVGVPYYKEDVAVTLSHSADCATAILMGMFPQMPINVTSTFSQYNKYGVAWNGHPPTGTSSNHSIYLAGLKMIEGVWYFIMVNSWGLGWGPWGNGCCLIPLQAIDNPDCTNDGWAHANTPAPPGTDPCPAPVLAV